MRTFEQCFASVPHAFEISFAPQLLHQEWLDFSEWTVASASTAIVATWSQTVLFRLGSPSSARGWPLCPGQSTGLLKLASGYCFVTLVNVHAITHHGHCQLWLDQCAFRSVSTVVTVHYPFTSVYTSQYPFLFDHSLLWPVSRVPRSLSIPI